MVHGANMGPTWVLSAPGGPHVDPMNLAIWEITLHIKISYFTYSWRESANGDFPCAKLENAKKNLPNIFFGDYEQTWNLYWLTCLDLPICQIWWLQLEKWVQECQKSPAHEMVHYAHI